MQYPPPYGPPGYGRPPYGGGPPPGMRPPGMPFRPPMQQPPPMPYAMAPIIKKTTLYVGKIATTVSDATMEALLNACGPLVSWKPMKDTDTQAPKGFGFAEFQEADGVYRATQLLQGLDVDGQQLMVKPDTATQRYLDSYMHQHPEVAAQGNDEALAKVMEVLSSLAAARTADKAAAEFLADVAGAPAPAVNSTPESRKRTREEREAMERAFKNTLHDWERHERDRMKLIEADRERERRAEADRARTVRLDLQGSAAEDEPRWRRPLYKDSHYAAERRHRRQREEEEDASDRRAEAEQAAAARQREEEAARAAAERSAAGAAAEEGPAAGGGGDVKAEEPAPQQVDPEDPIYRAMMAAAAQAAGQGAGQETQEPVKKKEPSPAVTQEVKPVKLEPVVLAAPVVAPKRMAPTRLSKPLATAFDDDEEEDEAPKRRTLIPIKYTAEEEAALQSGPRLGEEAAPAVDIKSIADAIPTSKDEVFAAPVDWAVLSDRVLSTLRTWVGQKVTELLGEEEPSLTAFIVDKLAAHTAAPGLLEELKEVLDEEAEGFVLRLYRTVLYETKKAAAGL